MPNTTLSIDQIAAIKTFINKRGFNTIEVEMEALDHLASKVESLLEERPEMNFDLAITKAHSSFGIFGLSSIEESLQKLIGAKVKDMVLKELSTYFFGRKVIISFAIIAVSILLLDYYPMDGFRTSIQSGFYLLGMLWGFLPTLIHRKSIKKWRLKSITIQTCSVGLISIQLMVGQGFGLMTQMMFNEGQAIFNYFFVFSFFITTLGGLVANSIMSWGIKWANEKYLKYA
ncbi:MAG: hypothetical protein ACJAXX_000454 [Roseivirga sp.]|jgi:hypothetical protein